MVLADGAAATLLVARSPVAVASTPGRTELPYSRASYAANLRELAETIRIADANIV